MKTQQSRRTTATQGPSLGGMNVSQVKLMQRTGSVSLLYSHDMGFTRHVVEIFENGSYVCRLNEEACFRRGTHDAMARLHGYNLTEMEGVLAAPPTRMPQAADPGDLFARPANSPADQLEQSAAGTPRQYRFRVVRSRAANGGEHDPGRFITVAMTEAQFEDYQDRKSCVHAAIEAQLGLSLAEDPAWREAPEVVAGFEEVLREAIGGSAEAVLLAEYPSANNHRYYERVIVNGLPYRYASFLNGRHIKWAPEAIALMH